MSDLLVNRINDMTWKDLSIPACAWKSPFCHSWGCREREQWPETCPSCFEWDYPVFSCRAPTHKDTGVSVIMITNVCFCAPELRVEVQNALSSLWNTPEMKNKKVGNTSTNESFSNLAFHCFHTMLSRMKMALQGILADLSELVIFQCARQIKPEAVGCSIWDFFRFKGKHWSVYLLIS